MVEHPLQSLAAYSRFVAKLLDRSSVERSTLVVWPASPYTGIAEGEVYRHDERLYWYDDFPHPNMYLDKNNFIFISEIL